MPQWKISPHILQERKDTWQLNTMYFGLDVGNEKDISGKTGENSNKLAVNSIVPIY